MADHDYGGSKQNRARRGPKGWPRERRVEHLSLKDVEMYLMIRIGGRVSPSYTLLFLSFQSSYIEACHTWRMANLTMDSGWALGSQSRISAQRKGTKDKLNLCSIDLHTTKEKEHSKKRWLRDSSPSPQSKQTGSRSIFQKIRRSKVGFRFKMNNQVVVECLGI